MLKSKILLPTLNATSKSIIFNSHKLMLQAGLVRQISSGLYAWLPIGLIILKKIENVIRLEMNKIGAQECLMSVLQDKELLSKTNRWNDFGELLFKIKDRRKKEYCLSPTHEEMISNVILKEVCSYKQLPIIVYQIQSKFRDEIRPRSGMLRTREFLMKDAYSFDTCEKSMNITYKKVYLSYKNIFNKIGLNYKSIIADSGAIGGKISQEFHAISNAGEDEIVYSTESSYAANIECATAFYNSDKRKKEEIKKVNVSHIKSASDKINFIEKKYDQYVLKIMFLESVKKGIIGIVAKINDKINLNKLNKIDLIKKPITFVTHKMPLLDVKKIDIYADNSVKDLVNFGCQSGNPDEFFINLNWNINCVFKNTFDMIEVKQGDISPDGKGRLKITKGIEIAHIFQLQDKYSKVFQKKSFKNEKQNKNIMMGCYGIGISRIVSAYIEQNHDEKGIIWSNKIHPFKIIIVAVNYKNKEVRDISHSIYDYLKKNKVDVLLDDDDINPGKKFTNMELIGIPHRLIISEKNIKNNQIEYSDRKENKKQYIEISRMKEKILNIIR